MSEHPLRLAVYGFVEKEAGGLASANFVVLERLLQRGHFVDFYAIDPFVRPVQLFDYPNFRYLGFRLSYLEWAWAVVNRVPTQAARWAAQQAYSQFTHMGYNRAIGKAIARAHRERTYDALLTLGLLSPFRVPEVLTVSWDQGTPNGERAGLIAQKQQLTSLCGWGLYAALMSYYRYREARARRLLRYSHLVICGSRWAMGSWQELGLPATRSFALPYPVDLDLFTPADRDTGPGPIRLLHLGRIVPRKRLDLLLEAFHLLRRDDPNVRLRVIGTFAYARGYQALLQGPRLMAGVEYQPHVPRAEAREALRQADVLVQPSENENFGTAVAEAQASGLPVVLGPSNGTRDYLDSDEFTFPTYDPRAVASALGRAVCAVRERRDELQIRARAAAERSYDVDRIVDRLLAILRAATADAHVRRQTKADGVGSGQRVTG
jgi:glycosyltransferase involved in cell wall biosynthesis